MDQSNDPFFLHVECFFALKQIAVPQPAVANLTSEQNHLSTTYGVKAHSRKHKKINDLNIYIYIYCITRFMIVLTSYSQNLLKKNVHQTKNSFLYIFSWLL